MPKAPLYVVPLDFSSDTEALVARAFALAGECGAQVHLLEVAAGRRPSVFGDHGDQLRVPDHERWSRLEKPIRAARARGTAVRVVEHRGDPATIIASHAQLAKARMIVIGQYHGTARWRRTTRIVSELGRTSPVPVLVLPPLPSRTSGGGFRNIVSAVDVTVASAVALRSVIDVARRTGARLTLVHALPRSPDTMAFSGSEAFRVRNNLQSQTALAAERLRRKVPTDIQIRVDARVTTGDPDRAILAIADEVKADLIVMGVPPRSRFDQVLFGSTLRRVLRRTTRPVLVLPVAAGAHQWLGEKDGVDVTPAGSRSRSRRPPFNVKRRLSG